MRYDVIVVGGGAAGMMAAHTAALYGKQVLLLERNQRLGKKILITGKGRCNVTNHCDVNTFLSNVTTNSRFLYSAASRFSPEDTMDYFQRAGVELKTERGNRVFPQSDRAKDIADALEQGLREVGVSVCQERVQSLWIEDGILRGVIGESSQRYEAGAVIVATGGKSYPLTGSTGDGYDLAKQAGHQIVQPKGSLVPVVTREHWCKEAQGLSLKNVTLTLKEAKSGKTVFSELGEMLFTHFGVSGPLVLSASAHMKDLENTGYLMSIDLKPGLDEKQLDARLLRDFAANVNRDFGNSLGALLPRKLIPVMIRLSGIPYECKIHQVTREMRQHLCRLIKNLELTPVGFRPIEEAIVTSGGVDVREVNPKTMESKQLSGLYFAGEVLDLDAYTGGFNLQIAFSTGYAAGTAAAGI